MQIDTNTPAQFSRPSLIRQGLVCAAKVLPAGLSGSISAERHVAHYLAGHDHLGALLGLCAVHPR